VKRAIEQHLTSLIVLFVIVVDTVDLFRSLRCGKLQTLSLLIVVAFTECVSASLRSD